MSIHQIARLKNSQTASTIVNVLNKPGSASRQHFRPCLTRNFSPSPRQLSTMLATMIPLASALRQTAPPISLRASPRTSLTTSTTLPQPPPAGADRAPDAPLPVSGCGHGPAVAAFPVVLVAHPQKLVASAPGGRQGRSPARAGGPQEQGQSALPGNLPAGFHPARPEALRGLLLCAGRCGKQSKGAQAPPLLPALLNQPVQCQRASLPVLDLCLGLPFSAM